MLFAFVLLLPFHNIVMAGLWDLGVRDAALDVVSAWKEVLLALALGALVWTRRGIPFKSTTTDWLAFLYVGFVVVYAVIPQDWLGGDATPRGVLYGLRHNLTPVAAYFLGRGITLGHIDRRRLGYVLFGVAGVVALWGLIDIYFVSLQTWRDSGVPGWFREQLGLDYGQGLSGLPENWVYNLGDERPLRRLVSTFLSPLATGYMLLVVILLARPGSARAGCRLSRACSRSGCSSRTRAPRSRRWPSGSSPSRTACATGGRWLPPPSSSRLRSSSSARIRTSRRRRASRRPSW